MDHLLPAFILQQYAAGTRSGNLSAAALFVDLSGFSTITDMLARHGQHGTEVLATTMIALFDPLVRAVYEHGGFISAFAGDGLTAIFVGDGDSATGHAVAAALRIAAQIRARPAIDTEYGTFETSFKLGLGLGDVGWRIITSTNGCPAIYYFQGVAIDGAIAAEQLANAGEIVLASAMYHAVAGTLEVEPVGQHFRIIDVSAPLPAARAFSPLHFDVELIARFLDPGILQQRASGEFRQVISVLLSLPTIRTAAQLDVFAQTFFALQDRYGGLANRLEFDDKGAHLVLFWGAPSAHENDVERALNFLLDLQTQTAIPLSAGVTYRIAHAGFIGGEWHSEYTCYGPGTNLAARFMTAAPRGEIWVDEHVAQRAAARFDVAFEREMTFKGFAQPEKVYVLLDRKDSAETFFEGAMVGRDAELARLARFVQPLTRGEYAGMMIVWGEPGLGKSRLLYAFLTAARMEHPALLSALCQTDEILRRSLNPFRYWLRRYFGVSPTLAEAPNKRSFNRKLDELIRSTTGEALAAELEHGRSFLGALVELRWSDSLFEELDAQARHDNTLIALTALMRAESLRQPVVILLEDAHWLDDDSKVFLAQLVQALQAARTTAGRSYPIAILATARPEETALPLVEVASDQLQLGQLDATALAGLLETHLGAPPTGSLVSMVAGRAEGNPFFAEQLVRYLKEEGLLQETAQGWDVRDRQLREPLPADVRAVLAARLDRLVAEVREVVGTAAVLGREFEVRLLSRMLKGDETLPGKVAAAEKAAIWSPLGELRYLFKHTLLRDTAYRIQVRARRQALHALAVSALEELYAADIAGHYPELAYHSEQAMLKDKARHYLRSAGDSASANYQNSLALDYYRRALAMTGKGDLNGRYELLLAQETLLRSLGRQEERQLLLERLAELVSALGDGEKQAAVAVRHAFLAVDMGDHARAVALSQEAMALAREAEAPLLVVQAHLLGAASLMRQGRTAEAERLAEAGRELAERISDQRGEAQCLNILGMNCLEREDREAAARHFARGLACARALGDRRLQAQLYNNLGLLAGHRGDYAAAQDHYEQALLLAREIGERAGEGTALGNLGWLAGMTAKHEEAFAAYARSLRIAREVGDRVSEVYTLINLSACLDVLADIPRAAGYAEEALQIAQDTGERSAEAWALTYLGHSHLSAGELEAAGNAYRLALAIRRELKQDMLATEPAAGLAAVHLARHDGTAAQAALRDLLPQLDGSILPGTDDPLRVYHTAYRVLEAAGDPRARTILEQAHSVLEERAQQIQDEAIRRAFLERSASHQAIAAAWQRLSSAPAAGN
jgi:class 3 adenylate cyclase/tetratricopeptide (TPR) repeat protein